jgi:hypothetical protein
MWAAQWRHLKWKKMALQCDDSYTSAIIISNSCKQDALVICAVVMVLSLTCSLVWCHGFSICLLRLGTNLPRHLSDIMHCLP